MPRSASEQDLPALDFQGLIMFFTIFCCISTGLAVYCILKRMNKRAIDLAVHSAVHEVKKELHDRNATMVAQLAGKEGELNKARDLVKLHEAVPTRALPATRTAAASARSSSEKPQREALDVFAMSRPFTDTSYDALLAVSDVVKVEPAAM
jgi:hypothetical protein